MTCLFELRRKEEKGRGEVIANFAKVVQATFFSTTLFSIFLLSLPPSSSSDRNATANYLGVGTSRCHGAQVVERKNEISEEVGSTVLGT